MDFFSQNFCINLFLDFLAVAISAVNRKSGVKGDGRARKWVLPIWCWDNTRKNTVLAMFIQWWYLALSQTYVSRCQISKMHALPFHVDRLLQLCNSSWSLKYKTCQIREVSAEQRSNKDQFTQQYPKWQCRSNWHLFTAQILVYSKTLHFL